MPRTRLSDKYDIIVTNHRKMNGCRATVISPLWGGIKARLETNEIVSIKNEEFEYISEQQQKTEDE